MRWIRTPLLALGLAGRPARGIQASERDGAVQFYGLTGGRRHTFAWADLGGR